MHKLVLSFWQIITTGLVGVMSFAVACQQDDLAATSDIRLTSNVSSVGRSGQVDVEDGGGDHKILPAVAMAGSLAEEIVPLGAGRFQYTYTLPAKVTQLDVVWMIDNSGSMKDNIAGVQANMAQFTTWLNSLAHQEESSGIDVQAYLISCDERYTASTSGTGTHDRHCIDFGLIRHDKLVTIHRPWAELDSYYLPKLLSEMAVDSNDPLGHRLASRGSSKKIFVIVTDEGAHPQYSVMTGPVTAVLDKTFGQKKIAFFSFSPPRTTNINDVLSDNSTHAKFKKRAMERNWLHITDQYFRGQLEEFAIRPFYVHKMCGSTMSYSYVYEYLAKYYQGKFYSICQPNWQDNFNEMRGDITAQVSRTLTLSDLEGKTNVQYHTVSIGGVVLSADEYTITTASPPQLTLRTSQKAQNVVITVSYDP